MLLSALPAQAHSPMPGVEGFYIGFLHPLTQPTQLMLLVALGAYAGSKASAVKGLAMAGLALAALVGLAAGAAVGATADRGPVLAALVILTAAGALYRGGLPGWLSVAALTLGGLLLGLACVPDPGGWRDLAITAFGSWVGITYFALMTVGGTVELLERWPGPATRIGVQVAAAWLIAMAAMYVAFLWFAPGAPGTG